MQEREDRERRKKGREDKGTRQEKEDEMGEVGEKRRGYFGGWLRPFELSRSCGPVAAACCVILVSQEAVGEKTWRQLEATTQTLRDTIQKLCIVNRWLVGEGYAAREIKLPQECFWLVLSKLALAAGVL